MNKVNGALSHNAWLADKKGMRALSIRQPYAELILRGIKPIEFRSRPTTIIGERFYIYASKKPAAGSGLLAAKTQTRIAGDNIAVPTQPPPRWMIELAEALRLWGPDADLPTGVIVGSAVIEKVVKIEAGSRQRAAGSEEDARILLPAASRPLPALYEWHLADIDHAKRLRKPKGHPQPVWFKPC